MSKNPASLRITGGPLARDLTIIDVASNIDITDRVSRITIDFDGDSVTHSVEFCVGFELDVISTGDRHEAERQSMVKEMSDRWQRIRLLGIFDRTDAEHRWLEQAAVLFGFPVGIATITAPSTEVDFTDTKVWYDTWKGREKPMPSDDALYNQMVRRMQDLRDGRASGSPAEESTLRSAFMTLGQPHKALKDDPERILRAYAEWRKRIAPDRWQAWIDQITPTENLASAQKARMMDDRWHEFCKGKVQLWEQEEFQIVGTFTRESLQPGGANIDQAFEAWQRARAVAMHVSLDSSSDSDEIKKRRAVAFTASQDLTNAQMVSQIMDRIRILEGTSRAPDGALEMEYQLLRNVQGPNLQAAAAGDYVVKAWVTWQTRFGGDQ